MRIIIDNQIVKALSQPSSTIFQNNLIASKENQIVLRWPGFFEYLGLETILANLPTFDQTQPLFTACVSTLSTNVDEEVLFYVFDRLFAENLNNIKSLKEIDADYLLEAIQKRRQASPYLELEADLETTLDKYERAFNENPSPTIHNLILYLAWDRMCVQISQLFDFQSLDEKYIQGLVGLKNCLIESFQHITLEGKTLPSFYRLIEALLFFYMREENLQKIADADWKKLSQSFQILKSQERLSDFYYIDEAIISEAKPEFDDPTECFLTSDSKDRVQLRLTFAQYMNDKLRLEVPTWGFKLLSRPIAYL